MKVVAHQWPCVAVFVIAIILIVGNFELRSLEARVVEINTYDLNRNTIGVFTDVVTRATIAPNPGLGVPPSTFGLKVTPGKPWKVSLLW
jgi:hypothetical protein